MSSAQHMQALARANDARLAAAALRREVAAGELSVEAALDDPRAGSLTLLRLLTAQRRWGIRRAQGVLRAMPCSEQLRVRAMTGRQKQRAAYLAGISARGLESETWRARAGLA